MLLLLVVCGLQARKKATKTKEAKHDKLRSVLNKKSTTKKSEAVVGAVVAVDKDKAPPPPGPPAPLKKKTAPPPEENPHPTSKHTKVLMEPWRERKHYEPEQPIPPPKELVKLVKKAKQKQCGGRRCVTHEEPAPKNILPELLNNPELLLAKADVPKMPPPAAMAPPPAARAAPAARVTPPVAAPPVAARVAPPASPAAPPAAPARAAPAKAPVQPKPVLAPKAPCTVAPCEPQPDVLSVALAPLAPPAAAVEPAPPPAMAAPPPPAPAMAVPTPAPFVFPVVPEAFVPAAPADGIIHTQLSDDGESFNQQDVTGATETKIEMSKKRNEAPANPDAPRAKVNDSQRVANEIAGQRSAIPFVNDE